MTDFDTVALGRTDGRMDGWTMGRDCLMPDVVCHVNMEVVGRLRVPASRRQSKFEKSRVE